MFQQLAEMGHERILLCSNPDVGLKAIIAVHSTALGPGLGGLRMYPFKDFDEAITDVLRLSRGMTYKAACAGLSFGGGKAVIIGDPSTVGSDALFIAYAPFDNPSIVVATVVEHGGGGSRHAAPVARAVIDAWLSQELAR